MFYMPMALVISSHVAASMVGGAVTQRVLNAAKIDTMLVPTVLYGRHPGWGEPGGGTVDPDHFSGMLEGINAQGLFNLTDVVLTGYFADVGQIFDTSKAIDIIRRAPREHNGYRAFAPEPIIVVDPIMGDSPGGLYVEPAIAAAIKDQLVSRADLLTPNLFELGRLTGRSLTDLASMVRAARALERPVLVSSLPRHGRIGVVYVDAAEAWIVEHDRLPDAPNGTGDLLTALFVRGLLEGRSARETLEHAVAGVLSVLMRAAEWRAFELPLVAAADVLETPLVQLQAEALN